MPGYVVYSPFDGKPVPAANEQIRDELIGVYGYHLTPPETGDLAAEQEPAQDPPAAEVGEPADVTPARARPSMSSARSAPAGDSDH